MPTPATPRRTPNRNASAKSTPPKPKPSEVGKLIGAPNQRSVLDKVRQWQDSGGGIVTAEAICVEVEEDEEPIDQREGRRKSGHEPSGRPKKENLVEDTTARNSQKQASRQASRLVLDEWDDRTRSVSAPKKRVVSDGHWRKQRNPPKDTTRRTSRPDIKKKINHDVIVVEYASDNESEKPTPKTRAKSDLRKSDISNDDGIRVYATPPSSRKTSRHLKIPDEMAHFDGSEVSNIESEGSDLGPEINHSAKHDSGKRKTSHNSTITDHESKYSRSSHQNKKSSEKSGYSTVAFLENRGSTKSQKSTILSQVFDESKKMFSRKEFVPLVTPRIPSVEAWLDETPDPFIDDPEAFIDVPAPLKSSNQLDKKEEVIVVPDDPNGIWDDLNHKESGKSISQRRRQRRVPSSSKSPKDLLSKDVDMKSEHRKSGRDASLDDTSDGSAERTATTPPSLRRRGAKRDSSSPLRERRKSSPLKECVSQDDDVASSHLAPLISNYSGVTHEPLTPLKPPGLNIRRPFPSTGKHKLSTIASVETFNSNLQNFPPPSISDASEATAHQNAVSNENELEEARDQFDPNGLDRRTSKNRIAKHDDLMSVLSLPQSGAKSIVSARSIRSSRSRLATASIEELMNELGSDEDKYMRELRTLVDGVIPVLLTCVLSKSDSAIAAGLFSPMAKSKSDIEVTRPIMDMGITLERLRKLHQRIPRQNPDGLLSWAQGAHKVYEEYLRAWRMGFQDVVVNLVPATEKAGGPQEVVEEGLPQNEDGDVVDSNGERVDVAFLLKRPLVRIKYLSKSFKAINAVRPSAEAEALTAKYLDLVTLARQRSNEERARMEDEAAAVIDPTRARDPRTLGPLTGVAIDSHRRVRARDYFNFDLKHSSGQMVDCRVEFLIRDDPPERGTSGDLLICEVDSTGRWLLFPPIQFGQVSARNGDDKGEIVVMLRGTHSEAQEWHELLVLRIEDEQTGFEWVHMLGLEPVPPKVMRMQSFVKKQERKALPAPPLEILEAPSPPSPIGKSRTPSPREMEIPIGEQAGEKVKTWTEPPSKQCEILAPSPPPKERNRLQKLFRKDIPVDPLPRPKSEQKLPDDIQTSPTPLRDERPRSADIAPSARTLAEKLGFSGVSSGPGLKRSKAKRLSKQSDNVNASPTSSKDAYFENDAIQAPIRSAPSPVFDQEHTNDHHQSLSKSDKRVLEEHPNPGANMRPRYHRSRSSVPSLELPTIPKVRKDSQPATPTYEQEEEPVWPPPQAELEPPETPPKAIVARTESPRSDQKPPPPPAHRSPSPAQIKTTAIPDLSSSGARRANRRSSSPLKHQYEPSTASESTSDSDTSTIDHKDVTSMSDSSSDEEPEDEDIPTPLVPLRALQRMGRPSPPATVKSGGGDSIAPSQSASQAPYKRVPSQPTKSVKAVASIFYWTDAGSWQSLHPGECSISITPGLIEAFEMSAAHSSFDNVPSALESSSSRPSSSSPPMEPPTRPLVALELTPLVPIRRGTALDISIRSPPTPSSLHTTSQNTLFRSRNPEECETLYGLINHARINNPTYIALQNARLTSSFTPTFATGQGKASGRGSWFGLGRKSSYRAKTAPTPTVNTDSSGNTLAKSWLKAFGQSAGNFSLSKSTVTTSQIGSRAGSVYTDSSGSGTSTPLPLGAMNGKTAHGAAKIGLENLAIRLYIKDSGSRWRDLGQGTLNVLRPENNLSVKPQGSERRVLVTSSKHRDKDKEGGKEEKRESREPFVMLDVTVGEAGFERVGRIGIAIGVWEELVDGRVAKEGGVVPGTAKTYMLQVSCLHALILWMKEEGLYDRKLNLYFANR